MEGGVQKRDEQDNITRIQRNTCSFSINHKDKADRYMVLLPITYNVKVKERIKV